jgi:hypothetical protein
VHLQIWHARIEAAEEKPAITGQARHACQPVILPLERRWIGAGGMILDADQRAGSVEGPLMIGAGQDLLIPTPRLADRGPAMRTGIDEAPDLSGLIAHQDHRLTANGGRQEIVGRGGVTVSKNGSQSLRLSGCEG